MITTLGLPQFPMNLNSKHILHQPYPAEISQSKKAGLTLSISLFVFLFLFFFAPFGLGEISFGKRVIISFGYGLACAAAMAVNYYLLAPFLPAFFDESN